MVTVGTYHWRIRSDMPSRLAKFALRNRIADSVPMLCWCPSQSVATPGVAANSDHCVRSPVYCRAIVHTSFSGLDVLAQPDNDFDFDDVCYHTTYLKRQAS